MATAGEKQPLNIILTGKKPEVLLYDLNGEPLRFKTKPHDYVQPIKALGTVKTKGTENLRIKTIGDGKGSLPLGEPSPVLIDIGSRLTNLENKLVTVSEIAKAAIKLAEEAMLKPGPEGEEGKQGPQGPAGANGSDGKDGESNYQIAKRHGFTGSEEEFIPHLVTELAKLIEKRKKEKKRKTRGGEIRMRIKEVGASLLAAGLVAAAITPAYYYPRPEGEKVPEVPVQTPEFGVRYDADLNICQVIDSKTGNVENLADHPYLTFGRKETGVGKTETIATSLAPGQAAVIEGWKVNGETGVFEVVQAGDEEITFTRDISDGAITTVDKKDAAFAFTYAVQTAIEKNWAHDNVKVPEEWIIK